jgi:predicted transcriptional regulator
LTPSLPYISIDDNFSLNLSLTVLIIDKLGLSSKKSATLDFEKIQILLYLVKNPSKINAILKLAEKKFTPINSQYTYTIESLSTNVDILFDRSKLKYLIKELAARGMLVCEKAKPQDSLKYLLSEQGKEFSKQLQPLEHNNSDEILRPTSPSSPSSPIPYYFSAVTEVIASLSALQSQTNSKLNSYLNATFKRI